MRHAPRSTLFPPLPLLALALGRAGCAELYGLVRVHNMPSLPALVSVNASTGRTHQLRRHFAEALGRPIVGDVLYDGGGPEALNFRLR